jgi:vacuolar-type H+-ATPase subunit H
VPHMRDFLSRFRPAGSPGAGPVAIPADRRRERETELGQVLVLLDGPGAECARIVGAARRDAEEILSAARSEADAVISAARRQAAATADQLVREALTSARAEAAALEAAGAARASAIRERAGKHVPGLAEQAVRRIKELAAPASSGRAPGSEWRQGEGDEAGGPS